jgi:molybdopterin-guanine dinucleotide biosynthesis protein A
MGEDKALIFIQGITLLERVCHIAQACADTVYIVTPWIERYQGLSLTGCEFIRESHPGQGPLVGFVQGLEQVQTDWVLLLACDLPKLKLDVLQNWTEQLDLVDSGAIACLVEHSQNWEPLCGFYRLRCLPLLVDFINQGGRSFQKWLKQHQVAVLALSELDMLFNCNRPEDLAFLNSLENESKKTSS